MAFSMHSHSGEFCPGHAVDTLESIVLTAIARGMVTFGLTEHMPLMSNEDLYPETIKAGETIAPLIPRHEAYLLEAQRLRSKYASQIKLLIAFEGEWIRPSYGPFIHSLAAHPLVDYFIGSVHHVHSIPIDYDAAFYAKAVEKAGSEEKLFEDYFDAQYVMLLELKPRVVGHFDLIRLLSSRRDARLKSLPGVWERVVRNLKVIVEQTGLLEINSAGLRKGLKEPYPGREICEEFMGMGGKFTLSDDSHGMGQVGTNYGGMLEYLEGLGVESVWTLEGRGEDGMGVVRRKRVQLMDVKASFRP